MPTDQQGGTLPRRTGAQEAPLAVGREDEHSLFPASSLPGVPSRLSGSISKKSNVNLKHCSSKEGLTVDAIQPELINQCSRTPDKSIQPRATMGDSSKVLTSFASTSNRENDSHLRVLLLQLDESPQTAFRAVHRYLGIGPLVTELPQVVLSKTVAISMITNAELT